MDWLGLGSLAVGGIASMFGGKKKDRNVPDSLAGLRKQLEDLGRQRQVWGEKAKELTGQDFAQRQIEGMQGINENIRAERGFGNTSLRDRLNTELSQKLGFGKASALLDIDKYVNDANARDIVSMSSMYPSGELAPEEPSWGNQLLGFGAKSLASNWEEENQMNKWSKLFGPKSTPSASSDSAWLDLLNAPSYSSSLKTI